MLSKLLFPGQSPGARTVGKSEKPMKPGTLLRLARTSAIVFVTAAPLGSSSRKASELKP